MDKLKHSAGMFLRFAFISGMGWLCDFATFSVLVKFLGVPGFLANFVSSYVGVTFVWFTSLGSVFKREGGRDTPRFLAIYWGFQFVSIAAYSQFLHLVAQAIPGIASAYPWAPDPAITAKILITPVNLLTNFVFMKFLTGFMQEKQRHHA